MAPSLSHLLALCAFLVPSQIYAAPYTRRAEPIVTLDSGTFVGTTDTATVWEIYASAYQFRIAPITAPTTLPLSGHLALSSIVGASSNLVESEDCLTINVWQPTGVSANAKLPVALWIYGGKWLRIWCFVDVCARSLLASSTIQLSKIRTNGGTIVQDSVKLGTPILYVSMNYRVSALGFLAGKEVKQAGVSNIGLQDQRQAMRWVQKYISAFGGDPTKVTIWGESAGAMCAGMQLVANGSNNEGLFRGAILQSGSPLPVADVTAGQKYYDDLVEQTSCQGSTDTLECLRQAPFDVLKAAIDSTVSLFSYQSLKVVWAPKVDGVFLTDNPQKLVLDDKVTSVPFITGDVDDEGTFFTLPLTNLTTDKDVKAYLASNYLPASSASDIEQVLTLYPQDITEGSPFNTGYLNAITP
ncbi:hypothetical protein NM688_g778 [Phlebia brevispora]|uniref:Uncharacterized protein n=1 Tax=Phlebia brevispora TaxID=194682 RepID=A0ACC1TDR2_9APHY|nr:hypothetical protein NM688_g778 [Phlebia brevispora]